MEKSVAQKLRLGIFVILGTIIFIMAVYFIGNRQQFFGKTETLKAHFENVNGLQEGNNVRFSGINVGYVKRTRNHQRYAHQCRNEYRQKCDEIHQKECNCQYCF